MLMWYTCLFKFKCHHQITHCKLKLNIEYHPPYDRLVWDYRKANIESIQMLIESVIWETLFNNKTVNKQVSIFNKTIMNIFSNVVPNKLVIFDDSNPAWMNVFIKNKIKRKHQIYKTYIKNGRKYSDYVKFQEATSIVSEVISKHKEKYLALELNDPMTTTKTSWSILKTFYNGKKVTSIPPLLINDKLISDFEVKANYFNSFAYECTSLDNSSNIT